MKISFESIKFVIPSTVHPNIGRNIFRIDPLKQICKRHLVDILFLEGINKTTQSQKNPSVNIFVVIIYNKSYKHIIFNLVYYVPFFFISHRFCSALTFLYLRFVSFAFITIVVVFPSQDSMHYISVYK